MDTSTHIIIGFGLASLAQIDPVISENSALTQAVIIGSILGSNAPDFDILYKFKGNNSYIKNHRSYSHSLAILPIWALLITLFLMPFFPEISYFHLFLWTFLAVIVHVLTDLLNVHGTQVLLPFHKTWISFDIIPLFDPFIMFAHLAGFLSFLAWEPGAVFTIVYSIIILYVLLRMGYQRWIRKQLADHFHQAEMIKLIPTSSVLKWNILIETNEDFLFGQYHLNVLTIELVQSKETNFKDVINNCPIHPTVDNFLSSTHYAFPFVEKRRNSYLILWKDLRFRQKRFFPYLAIIHVSPDGREIYSVYSGWIYSFKQLRKVLKKMKRNWKEVHF